MDNEKLGNINVEGDNNLVLQGISNSHIVINYEVKQKNLPPNLTQIPESLSRFFVGREENLNTIKDQLFNYGGSIAIVGLGGIGKSALVQEYVKRYQAQYNHIVYIEANNKFNGDDASKAYNHDAFLQAFLWNASLIRNLGFEFKDEQLSIEKLEVLFNILQNLQGRNLIVIDNVSSIIKRYDNILPRYPNWHIILTSRQSLPSFVEHNLGKLPDVEALTLFYTHYKGTPNDSLLLSVFKIIDNHTLTIKLLAKTAMARKLSIDDLHGIIEIENLNFQKMAKVDLPDDENELTLIEHLLKRLALQLEPIPRKVLSWYSVLPTVPIKVEDIMLWNEIPAENEQMIFNASQSLIHSGWLSEHTNGALCHPIIKLVAKIQLNPTIEDCEKMIDFFNDALHIDETKGEHGVYKRDWVIYGQSILESFDDNDPGLAQIADRVGWIFRDLQDYNKSLQYQELSLNINQNLVPLNLYSLAIAYGNLALTYTKIDNYEKSLELNIKAVKIREKILSKNDPVLAVGYNNLGSIYIRLKDFKNALFYLKKSLKIREKILNKNHLELAFSYNNLASLYLQMENHEGSLKYYFKALAIREKSLSLEHPLLYQTYYSIGEVYFRKNEIKKAVEFYEKAVVSYDALAAIGENKNERVDGALAVLYIRMGNYEKSLEYGLKALEQVKATGDSTNVPFALANHNIAAALCQLGRYPEAELHISKAISIYKEKLNYEDDYYVRARNWLQRIQDGLPKNASS